MQFYIFQMPVFTSQLLNPIHVNWKWKFSGDSECLVSDRRFDWRCGDHRPLTTNSQTIINIFLRVDCAVTATNSATFLFVSRNYELPRRENYSRNSNKRPHVRVINIQFNDNLFHSCFQFFVCLLHSSDSSKNNSR